MNNKILQNALVRVFLSWFLSLIFNTLTAQTGSISRYGLRYVNSFSIYRKSLENHPEKKMESLKKIPGLILDLRYASTDNFMHTKLYLGKISTTYLRKRVFTALDSVSGDLRKLGFQLVIFDATGRIQSLRQYGNR